jgi:glycolate oxidase FAD binding subunit
MPKPAMEQTLVFEKDVDEALILMNQWAAQAIPLSAAAYVAGTLFVRLSGTDSAVKVSQQKLGGELHKEGELFWQSINEQQHPFFQQQDDLWRLSLAPAIPSQALEGHSLIDWGGAQRWLMSEMPAYEIRAAVEEVGGHATLFRQSKSDAEIFHPLSIPLAKLHRNLKLAFDPERILNRHGVYKDE